MAPHQGMGVTIHPRPRRKALIVMTTVMTHPPRMVHGILSKRALPVGGRQTIVARQGGCSPPFMDPFDTPCKIAPRGPDFTWNVKVKAKVDQQKRMEGITNLPSLPQTALAKLEWIQQLVGIFQKIDMSAEDYLTKWILLCDDWIGDPGKGLK